MDKIIQQEKYYLTENQVQNKPTAAFVLSLLGGIIGLLISIYLLIVGALAYSTFNVVTDWTSDFYGSDIATGLFGWVWGLYLALGAWMLITSILIIIFATKLNSNPLQHKKYGILILVFSIIGVGGLLGLIGGILALVYKPILAGAVSPYASHPQAYGPSVQPASYVPQYQQPTANYCPQCGTSIQQNVRYCPNCGRQQY